MFRILLSAILLVAKLQAAAGDNLVQKDLGFRYSLKENGNGSVKYNIPEYSLQSFITDDGKVYKKPVMMDAGQVSMRMSLIYLLVAPLSRLTLKKHTLSM